MLSSGTSSLSIDSSYAQGNRETFCLSAHFSHAQGRHSGHIWLALFSKVSVVVSRLGALLADELYTR